MGRMVRLFAWIVVASLFAQGSQGASFLRLASYPELSAFSFAHGISADDRTAIVDALGQAYLWNEQSGPRRLDGLALPGVPIQPYAISADGRVVAATQGEMVLWDAENGWQSKGHSFGAGGVTVPHALSADGSVVVGTGLGSLNRTEAVRWDACHGSRPQSDL